MMEGYSSDKELTEIKRITKFNWEKDSNTRDETKVFGDSLCGYGNGYGYD